MRSLLFATLLFLVLPLSAAVDCINREPVTEACLNEVYEAGDEETFLEFFPRVEFREKEAASARRVLALYRTGREAEIPAALKALPEKRRRTLLFRYLAFRAAFSTKRWNEARTTLEGISRDYPAFYRERAFSCLEGDISFAEGKMTEAVARYDRCLREEKNEAAAYNRLLAKEGGKGPQEPLIGEYLAFLEEGSYLTLREKVRDRLLVLRRRKGVPAEGTPLFPRWFAVMRREGVADEFYCDQLTTQGYPLSLEAVRYLMAKKRYGEAIAAVDREIAKCESEECRYAYGWEKFRILSWRGEPATAGRYLQWLAMALSGQRRDRVLFHAALSFIEAFDTKTARAMLEETVFSNPKSPFFVQSLYRLGLIHLMEGNEFAAYLLWGNFLFGAGIPPRGLDIKDAMRTMSDLTLFYDRLYSYYLFSSPKDYDCVPDEDPECTVRDLISYYDFLYYHLGDRSELAQVAAPAGSDDERRARWREAARSFDDDPYEALVAAVGKAPTSSRRDETVESLFFFAQHRILDGLLFYERYARDRDAFLMRQGQRDDPTVSFIMRELALPVYWAAEKYHRIIDLLFDAMRASLKYAPQYGDRDRWKILYPVPHFDAVMRLSEEFALSPALIYAVMRAESFYRDWVVSPAGAMGLMQVMPATFRKISARSGIKIGDPFNPYESLKAGAWYLSKLLKRFDGNILLAVAAYNAGPERVSQWYRQFGTLPAMSFIELIPYQETRNYVKKVTRFFEIYSYLYEGTFYNLRLGEPLGVREDQTIVDF